MKGGETLGSIKNRSICSGGDANSDPSAVATEDFSYSFPLSPDSSSSSSNYILPLLTTSAHRLSPGDENDSARERSSGSSVDCVFEFVPDRTEVENAIAAFQSFMQGLSSSKSTSNWLHPLWSHYYQRILQSTEFQRLYDAFHLLQTVPSVQRMVASISTDRAVWHAVLKNSEVQKFHRSLKQAEICKPEGSDEELHFVYVILRCILDSMKIKIVGLIETLKSLVSTSIKSSPKENINPELKHRFEEIIGSTVQLSTITLIIVLVTRVYGARSYF